MLDRVTFLLTRVRMHFGLKHFIVFEERFTYIINRSKAKEPYNVIDRYGWMGWQNKKWLDKRSSSRTTSGDSRSSHRSLARLPLFSSFWNFAVSMILLFFFRPRIGRVLSVFVFLLCFCIYIDTNRPDGLDSSQCRYTYAMSFFPDEEIWSIVSCLFGRWKTNLKEIFNFTLD